MQQRARIIAEAGVNHNGDLARALTLVDTAARAGADIIKFQSFRADKLATAAAAKASYQQATTGRGQSQLEMLRSLELSENDECEIAAACTAANIAYLSTPFDADSATHLVRHVGVSAFKVGSGDLTNAPLLLHLARFGLPIILSTGMGMLGEIEQALGVIAFGYLREEVAPSTSRTFSEVLLDRLAWSMLRDKVTLLHCTTEYPAAAHSINLRAMASLREAFGLEVGFSDHSVGIHIPVAALALGATVIEKHFTLDRNLPGPDHRASLEPNELAAMIAAIRDVESAMGDGRKIPAPEELANRSVARRSLVVTKFVRRGERFSADNLGVKRPGMGISPMEFWTYLDQVAARDYEVDEAIEP